MNNVSSLDISNTLEFKELSNIVIKSICKRYQVKCLEDIENLGSDWFYSKGIDLRDDTNTTLEIDNKLRILLDKLKVKADFMQFPVNIRLYMPKPMKNSKLKEYNTDELHCDHWSGSPSDSTNCFLYIHKKFDSTYLAFYDFEEKDLEKVRSYRGSYLNAPKLEVKELKQINKTGILHLWNCQTPHKTVRIGPSCTVSIDFRLRSATKIFNEDLNKKEEVWIKSRMTSLGVYWIISDQIHTRMEEKIKSELELSKNYGTKYTNLRREYLKSHYNQENYIESP